VEEGGGAATASVRLVVAAMVAATAVLVKGQRLRRRARIGMRVMGATRGRLEVRATAMAIGVGCNGVSSEGGCERGGGGDVGGGGGGGKGGDDDGLGPDGRG